VLRTPQLLASFMTWSIIARDGDGRFGVAIASRFFAVGALCVHTRRGAGALSTQALMNPLYGPAGIAMLAEGRTPQETVSALVGADPGRSHRQLHVVAAGGEGAAHTGDACIEWCGHRVFDHFSVAGNMLAGPDVLDATADAFIAGSGTLAERLIAALRAGEAAGGDKRGKQSAALRIQGDEDYPQLDIRVDDHAEPVEELERLHRVSLERFQPFAACLAGRRDAVGELDRSRIEARIEAFQAERRRGA
jgi:uncharacterized Ntn-hydrolase superfamily protein